MNIENTIRQFLEDQAEIIAVYLYGSAATERIHSESDIDVAVLFRHDQIPSIDELLEYRTNLSLLLERELDLVCLNEVSPILQKQIISKGKPILVNDQHQLNQFIIRAFTDYVDLKIARQYLEKYVLNRRVLDG